jgi:hypothetical protein
MWLAPLTYAKGRLPSTFEAEPAKKTSGGSMAWDSKQMLVPDIVAYEDPPS